MRSENDLALCRKIYQAANVLVKEDSAGKPILNPWRIKVSTRTFHMSEDSEHFVVLAPSQVGTAAEQGLVPLYEGKMFWQFDHRYASVGYLDDQGSLFEPKSVSLKVKQQQGFSIAPRYWVKRAEVQARMLQKGWDKPWTLAWRDVARSTDDRTIIATVLPSAYAMGHP